MRLFRRRARAREQQDELLSACLDGELDAEERARLVERLAADRALRTELEALRRTVALVRDLPSLPVPRNFILPQTAAVRPQPAPPVSPRRAWVAPLLTAATAVVSLAFVVVLAGGLLFPGADRQAAAPAAEPALETAQEAPMLAEVQVTLEVEARDEETVGMAAIPTDTPLPEAARVLTAPGGMGGGPTEAPPPGMDMGTPGMGGGGPIEETAPLALSATSPPGPAAAEKAEEAPTALAMPAPNGNVGLPTDDGGEAASKVAGEEEPQATESQWDALEGEAGREAIEQRAGLPPRLMWAIILGVLALGLALAAVWAWRARR
jgi:anti-sigma factor RsiW